jgi:hypothetical protein
MAQGVEIRNFINRVTQPGSSCNSKCKQKTQTMDRKNPTFFGHFKIIQIINKKLKIHFIKIYIQAKYIHKSFIKNHIALLKFIQVSLL